MDWFSWLSRTSLHPSLVYEYGLALAHNQLEHQDILYFNHEFLQSIGIAIAKHRLEILKLARKDSALHPRPVTRLLLALKRTKRRFADLIRSFTYRDQDHSKALVLVPRSSYAPKLPKRNRSLTIAKQQGRLLLTNGSPAAGPILHDRRPKGKKEIRWDTMFQDLKPT